MKNLLFIPIVFGCLSAFGASPAFTDFNTNQFANTGAAHKVSISDGASLTNLHSRGTLLGDGVTLYRLDMGTITGASTANLSPVTNLYYLEASGATWNLNLPAVPTMTNSPFIHVMGSNTFVGTQIVTLQVNSVTTAIRRTDLKLSVTTITNDPGAFFEYVFDCARGKWAAAKALGDAPGTSGGSDFTGTNLFVPGTVFSNNEVVTNGVTRLAQAVVPSPPASGFTEYSDSSGRRAWIRASDGFTRTWDAILTTNRIYGLPDASGTLALIGREQFRLQPFTRVDGVGCTIPNTNDVTTNTYLIPRFSGTAATNANFARYARHVPKFFNTTIVPSVSVTVRLSAADTAAASYNIGFADVANSSPSIATVGTWINIPIAADATGAYDDIESVSDIPLTGWNTGLTPGHWWVIELNRNGAGDASTNAQDVLEIAIDYGLTQSSPVVWMPTSPTNSLVEWLDASVQSYLNNDPVPTFVASAGKDATGAGAQRPTFQTNQQNGKPTLSFDGTANVLQTAAFSIDQTQPLTAFLVYRTKGFGTASVAIDGIDVAKRNAIGENFGAGQHVIYCGTSNQTIGTTNANYNIIMAEFNGASTKYRVNAGAEGTVAGTPGNENLSGLSVGGRYDATGFTGCNIAEIIIYSSILSSADKIQAFNYLNSKWAIY